jgi:hypothetical protein
VESPVVVYVV